MFDKPLTRVLWCVAVSLLVSGIGLGSTTAEPRTGLAELHDHSHGAQRRGGISDAYRRRRDQWHKRAPRRLVREWQAMEPPPLVLRPVWTNERFTLTPDAEGAFNEEQMAKARQALSWRRDGSHREIHGRLVELIYRAALEFDAPWVWVVSGFRGRRPTSRHFQGRAADIVLPGVRDRRLAHFLRRQGFVGVGVYPVSGFVHLDVRQSSFFWFDYTGPGQAQRNRPTMFGAARRFDRQAASRGELRTPDLEASAAEAEAESQLVRPERESENSESAGGS